MAWVVTAIVGGGLLAGAGALGGAALQGSAAERAGRRQAESYEKGIEEQRQRSRLECWPLLRLALPP